jgi:hypothetical protein
MLRSIEIEYEGRLDQEVLDFLVQDLGLLVERIRPLVVRTDRPQRDVPAVIGATRLIPGLRHIWIRPDGDSVGLVAGVAE